MTGNAKRNLTGVKELLSGVQLPSSVKQHIRNHSIWTKWADIVGPDLSRVTAPIEIRSKVLFVQVAHQAWAQQLHFLKPSLLGKIRTFSKDSDLKDLQFRVGTVERPKPAKVEIPGHHEMPEHKNIKLSERQEMTLRAVEDPELRVVIRKAMEAEVARSLQKN